LLIRKDENPEDMYVLVWGSIPGPWFIPGWAFAHEVMLPQNLQTYGGREEAYFAPHSILRDFSTLPWPKRPKELDPIEPWWISREIREAKEQLGLY
jgi:hypothetical protein